MTINTNNTVKPSTSSTSHSAAKPNKASTGEPQVANKAASTKQAATEDSVVLSAKAQTLGRLQEKMASASEVDTDKVATLKQAIAEGRFEINPDRLAEAMLAQDELLG